MDKTSGSLGLYSKQKEKHFFGYWTVNLISGVLLPWSQRKSGTRVEFCANDLENRSSNFSDG